MDELKKATVSEWMKAHECDLSVYTYRAVMRAIYFNDLPDHDADWFIGELRKSDGGQVYHCVYGLGKERISELRRVAAIEEGDLTHNIQVANKKPRPVCAHCGGQCKKGKVYCSNRCARLSKAGQRDIKSCHHCGRPLNTGTTYCSPACSAKARYPISERNKAVLDMICQGKVYREIAASFGISRSRIHQIKKKHLTRHA